MSDFNTIMAALRKADAAGNKEDAVRLAQLANQFRNKQNSTSPISFVGKGVSEVLGAPVDLISGGLNLIPGLDIKKPIGGSERMKEDLETFGVDAPTREAETIPEHIAQVTGEAGAASIPIFGTVKYLSYGKGLVGKVANSMWSTMKRNKAITAASEATATLGAGTGRGVGQEYFPDNKGFQMFAETVGGVAGGIVPSALMMTPTATAIKVGRNVVKKALAPFTKEGGKYRASKFIRGKVSDPRISISEIDASDLPPAVASGQKRLIQLYENLMAANPATEAEAIKKMSDAVSKNIKQLRKLGYDAPELLADVTEKRIKSLELSMDKRAVDALQTAQNKLDKLPVAKRRVHESRIVRNELDKVMKAEKTKVDSEWAKVPKDMGVGTNKTQRTYVEILGDLSYAQKEDIPKALKGNPIFKEDKTTIKEMQGLRSKLLETARNARKDGQWNKARIANKVADSILEDIADTSSGSDALSVALSATQKFKQKFEQGTVGKLLGYGKSGVPAIDPDITLDMSVGRAGQRGSLDIEKIAVTPEAKEATKRYIARSFTDYATDKTGKINPSKAQKWISNNEAILDKFPGMEKQLTDINNAQELATRTKIRMDARKQKLRDPKISTAARFLNSNNMGVTVEAVFKSRNPGKTASELVKLSKADQSGEALNGLKGAFVEHFLEKSKSGNYNNFGEKVMSGRAMMGILKDNRIVLSRIFTPKQISRIEKVASELIKIETLVKARAQNPNIELNDIASRIYGTGARVVGAGIGGKIGASSAGGSLQMAQIYSGAARRFMAKITRDKAVTFVHDAIMSDDPKLLKALLESVRKPKTPKWNKGLSIYNPTINAWLAGTGKRVLEDDKETTNLVENISP